MPQLSLPLTASKNKRNQIIIIIIYTLNVSAD